MQSNIMNSTNQNNYLAKSPNKLKLNTALAASATENSMLSVNKPNKPTFTASAVVNASNVSTFVQKEFQTPNSLRKPRTRILQTFPIVNTPTPPSRYRKINNPFEADLADRLHLPLIDR